VVTDAGAGTWRTATLAEVMAGPTAAGVGASLAGAASGAEVRKDGETWTLILVRDLSHPPAKVWQALTDPAFTERYWGMTFESDWKTGSTMVLHHEGVTVADPEQLVLEAEPFRRLSYTWHTFTPEWAQAMGIDESVRVQSAAEPRAKMTFDIEDDGDVGRLTVVHDGFAPGKRVALVPEPDNEVDPHAIGIWDLERRVQAGYVPADVARRVQAAELQAVSLWEWHEDGRRVGLRVLLAPRDAWIGAPRA